MKTRLYLLSLLCLILAASIYYSCRKDAERTRSDAGSFYSNEPLVAAAQKWFKENSALPKPEGDDDIDVTQYTPDWKHYALSKNHAGQKVVTVPLSKKGGGNHAFLTEIGMLVDSAGNSMGMIKEYMADPHKDATEMHIYTGNGRMFQSGTYFPEEKALVPDGKFELANKINPRLKGDGDSPFPTQHLEEVVVNGGGGGGSRGGGGGGSSDPDEAFQLNMPPELPNPTPPVPSPMIPVAPGGPSLGDSPKVDHSLPNKNNLPSTHETPQVLATCVFESASRVATYLSSSTNVNLFVGSYALARATALLKGRTDKKPADTVGAIEFNLITKGLPLDQLDSFINQFFEASLTASITQSIDAGNPLMATIQTDVTFVGHEVMITGYNNDGSVQYFDPQTGTYEMKPSVANFQYVYTITKRK